MSGRRVRRILRGLPVLALALSLAPGAEAQRLVEWVEGNEAGDPDRIALGYPVPEPVNSPLPFDGFRSYAALHARHQDLALTTPWVHPEIIGETRLGRAIWAYRLGDADRLTPWGQPEPATVTNGGIHAREWQTPEVVTGILELMATAEPDRHFLDYLREHVNMVVIPVLNVDGFLQTQRYPALNYLDSDPSFPASSPRDGRMRRKNLLGADEDLASVGDHLQGVDLNRNNPPYWASSDRSSDDERSLVHHGSDAQSEPETRALDAAAALGPAEQLRLYTDVHSFSQVHLWGRTDNERLARQTEEVLRTFTEHHRRLSGEKWYAYSGRNAVPRNSGIGTTDEYFTVRYEVPSWTLEVEPTNGQSFHRPLPGAGADYGGAGVNGHDGFILPEAEIRRVRENLARSFAAAYYRQAGPPHVQTLRVIDEDTGALVYEADWINAEAGRRRQVEQRLRALELGRTYRIWLAFSKPMRWLEDGAVALFPGQFESNLALDIAARLGDEAVALDWTDGRFALDGGGAPDGFLRYRTDAWSARLVVPDTEANRARFAATADLQLLIRAFDMMGMGLDADPSTVATWAEGHWVGYEDVLGNETDFGGRDTTLSVPVATDAAAAPFLAEAGLTAAWFDPDRDSEGFIIELLDDGRAVVYWATYDGEGAQDWYIGVGEVRGNRIVVPELLQVSGPTFGPGAEPDSVRERAVGSLRFTWSDCDAGVLDWHVGNRRGRQALLRLTEVAGLECGPAITPGAPLPEEARRTGNWADLDRPGEGFVLEVLDPGTAVVWWFTYDAEGKRRWLLGPGTQVGNRIVFDELFTSRGGRIGEDPVEGAVEVPVWGRMELELRCSSGTATWESDEDGFGSGVMNLVRLTQPVGTGCD